MTRLTNRTNIAERRAELMAELFLQELDPSFLSQAPNRADAGYDLLVGFPNKKAGVNTVAVQVKATQRSVTSRAQIPREDFDRLVNSNIPALLLVADVKRNRLYYAWLQAEDGRHGKDFVSVPVTEVDEEQKKRLSEELHSVETCAAVAGA